MMSINELIKEIMEKETPNEVAFAEKLGYSQPQVSKLVNNMIPSKKIIVKLYQTFPDYGKKIVRAYLQSQLDRSAKDLLADLEDIDGLNKVKKEIMIELQAQHLLGLKHQPLYALIDQAVEHDPQSQKYIKKILEGLVRG